MAAIRDVPHRIPATALDAEVLPPGRISVDQYHQMIAAGVVVSGDHLELLDGLLVEKMAKKPPHVTVVARLLQLLLRSVPETYLVHQEAPVTLLQTDSEPELDISIVPGPGTMYLDRHPSGEECVLVAEVADSSIRRDLVKADLYAAAGVPVYWIFDIDNRELVVHKSPTPTGYRDISTVTQTEIRVGDAVVGVNVPDLLAGFPASA